MKVGVIGFGHFAGVVAACLCAKHDVKQYDETPFLVRKSQKKPEDEQGWIDLMHAGVCITSQMDDRDLVWIAYDVPLDTHGAPMVAEILARIERLDAARPKAIPFLVSCQWPVGTMHQIALRCPGREFVYVLENVRVGKAIADFLAQPIPLFGCEAISLRTTEALTAISGAPPLVMNWASAEMAKHALNAFMAIQIAFINEIARVCDAVGANAADVSRALLADARVSPLAYLKPGGPFGGGSLTRDLLVLGQLRHTHDLATPLLDAILESNGVAETLAVQPR